MIKLNDLAIGYNGEAILEHIDQEFDDGLIYGILAKSGAGKTTLLKTISGLLHPVHGEVVIDGTTYRNADKNPVYMMHQRYSNFGWLSCTENVLIAQRDKKLRSRVEPTCSSKSSKSNPAPYEEGRYPLLGAPT